MPRVVGLVLLDRFITSVGSADQPAPTLSSVYNLTTNPTTDRHVSSDCTLTRGLIHLLDDDDLGT